ncbi:MAG: dUTP diphosphatase [Anaerovoracaceae bacterium]|jgi:dUTP pyrophosphatase
MKVKIHSRNGRLPAYETEGAAGMDIRAHLDEQVVLMPGERKLIPTGLRIQLPQGYEGQLRARSGLSINHGICLINGVGTIDSDYRGEVKVALINLGQDAYTVKDGDRIAQLVVAGFERVSWEEEESLSETARSDGGFGHTGK